MRVEGVHRLPAHRAHDVPLPHDPASNARPVVTMATKANLHRLLLPGPPRFERVQADGAGLVQATSTEFLQRKLRRHGGCLAEKVGLLCCHLCDGHPFWKSRAAVRSADVSSNALSVARACSGMLPAFTSTTLVHPTSSRTAARHEASSALATATTAGMVKLVFVTFQQNHDKYKAEEKNKAKN